MRWLKVSSAVVISLMTSAIHVHCQPSDVEGSSLGFEETPVIVAWIEKAPYVISPTNGSSVNEDNGMIIKALLGRIEEECGHKDNMYKVDYRKVGSEFEMLELLKQNRVHIAVPIFEHPTNRRYDKFPFFKIDDYPGTEYITVESQKSVLSMVLNSVSKSWPLLAVTLVLTAIAGIIVWALVGLQFFQSWGCNFLQRFSCSNKTRPTTFKIGK